jgi:BlaI family transcriptional regulator, penicillinase repressor
LIDELLDILGGSARPLMAHLAETGKLSLEDVREIEMRLSAENDQGPSGDKSRSPRRAISRSRRKD